MTNGFQLVMPLDCEVNIEKNAPVRLLNAIMERMDYSKLYAAYMRNGQLKPGYNVNVATCSEFIIGSYISSDRSDMHTLIPFMEQLRKDYKGKNISSVVVDSGYESEENYCWFEAHPETELYVKPSNHEVAKHKKYRTDISRRENMTYISFICIRSLRSQHFERFSSISSTVSVSNRITVTQHVKLSPDD